MFHLLPTHSTASADWRYIIILVILFVISLIVQGAVSSSYKKYSQVFPRSGLTGAEAAMHILHANNVYDVSIGYHDGQDLSDYYDPRNNSISLSRNTYQTSSVAAIGVACHEAGHALQEAQGYTPYRIRRTIIPIANISSKLSMVLILAGFVLSLFAERLKFIGMIGVIMFGVVVALQLITLPVEINASHRALALLKSENILTETELPGAKKVLTAAALTYVVATLTAVIQLLRFISLFSRK